jgi:hypothetical protein
LPFANELDLAEGYRNKVGWSCNFYFLPVMAFLRPEKAISTKQIIRFFHQKVRLDQYQICFDQIIPIET